VGRRSWAIQDYVTDISGTKRMVYRKPRSIKHQYVWFANPEDRQLLKGKWAPKPYPTVAAKQAVED